MEIQREKAAQIQELLKKLSTSGTFESVNITKEIQKLAREAPTRREAAPRPEIVREASTAPTAAPYHSNP